MPDAAIYSATMPDAASRYSSSKLELCGLKKSILHAQPPANMDKSVEHVSLELHSGTLPVQPQGRYNISPDLNKCHMYVWEVMVTDLESSHSVYK